VNRREGKGDIALMCYSDEIIMHWYILLAGVVLMLIFSLYYTNALRYAKSLYLIAQITPYEQVGTSEKRILIIGDSTGYGTGARDQRETIAGRIGAEWPEFSITNKSVNGDTIASATDRVKNIDGQYDLILLQLGANDIIQKHPLADVLNDLEQLIAILTPHTKEIVMMSAGNVGGAPAFRRVKEDYQYRSRQFHQALEEFAVTQPHFTYVHFYEDPAEDPFVLDPARYMALDGLHPTDAGYGLWYQTLAPVLKKILSAEELHPN